MVWIDLLVWKVLKCFFHAFSMLFYVTWFFRCQLRLRFIIIPVIAVITIRKLIRMYLKGIMIGMPIWIVRVVSSLSVIVLEY